MSDYFNHETTIVAGKTLMESFVLYRDDAGTDAFDWTGWTLRGSIRRRNDFDGDPIVEYSESNSRVQFNDPRSDGVVRLYISAADTAGLPPGQYVREIERVSTDHGAGDEVVVGFIYAIVNVRREIAV